MPLDPRARRFLDMVALGAGEGPRPPIAVRRQALAKLMQFARADRLAPPGRDGTWPGPGGPLRWRLYRPDSNRADGPGLLFFHGGGLVAGDLDTHDTVCRALAAESGFPVIALAYRLAPEHPFPAALEDARAALEALSREGRALGIDQGRLALVGESGGGTLAARLAQEVRRDGPHIALQVLICPVLDFAEESASRRELARGYLIDRETLEADLADYAPGVNRMDPRLSPLREADLNGLPPAIIHTADFDPLRDEGVAYAERLAVAGVAVDHTLHAGMPHNFHALGAVLPQGRAVLATIGRQIAAALG